MGFIEVYEDPAPKNEIRRKQLFERLRQSTEAQKRTRRICDFLSLAIKIVL